MSQPALPPGTTVNDRYVLNGKLGSDGDVYRAHDRHLDKTVALKLLHPTDGRPQAWDEAKRLEQLRSSFIVPVINADVVQTSDIRFIATALLSDGDLEANARPHGLPLTLAVRFGHQIAAGIDTVHAAGMIHRDIKPANVLRNGDSVRVSDVATCSMLDRDGRAPRDGSWCTLAPEVAPNDGYCSVASDVYSLGATVFYLVSGEYPVDHRRPRHEQQAHIAAGDLRDIADVAPHVPRSVATVVRRAMSIDPSARYANPGAFGNALVTAMGRRRDWRRVAHEGHLYCAESPASGQRRAVAVCAEMPAGGQVTMRAFHPGSGRTVAGMKEKTTSGRRVTSALRSYIASIN